MYRSPARLMFLATFATVALLSGDSLIASTFSVADTCGAPDEESFISVRLDLEEDDDVSGFSLGIAFDTSALDVDTIEPGADIKGFGGGSGPDFFAEGFHDGGITLGVVFDFFGFEILSGGDIYEVAVLVGVPSDDLEEAPGEIELEFTDELGSPSVGNAIVVGGSSVATDVSDGVVELCVPDMEITCEVSDSGEVTLTWPDDGWDSVWISVGDEDPDEVDGADTSSSVQLESAGEYTFSIYGSIGEIEGEADSCTVEWVDSPSFLRGDANGNGSVQGLLDPLFLLEYGFQSGDAPPCLDAADGDDSGDVSFLLDSLLILTYSFGGGDAPPDPGPEECGIDPTDDEDGDLGCESPADC